MGSNGIDGRETAKTEARYDRLAPVYDLMEALPEGVDLAYVLGPFVKDQGVFSNPLKEEAVPGETLSDLCKNNICSGLS